MSKFGELLTEYMEKFGDSPPVFGLPEEEAISLMRKAIKNGEPAESNLPEGHPS